MREFLKDRDVQQIKPKHLVGPKIQTFESYQTDCEEQNKIS